MKKQFIVLVFLFFLLISSFSFTVQAQSFSQTVVSTELINYYSMTTSEVNTVLQKCYDQGITMLTLRINSYSEWSSNSNTAISKIKTIIPLANAQGISINVDLHTWYTTWDNSFRDSASNSANNRNTYINYVKTTLAAFNGYNVFAFMVLNEPQARSASSGENTFILNIVAGAHQVTTKPVSVRFMCGYSPSTGHYSSQIDVQTDFLCRNTYWDPRNPGVTVYGSTEAKVNTAISTAHSQGKGIWFTEFGSSSSNENTQAAYVAGFVSFAKTKSVDAIFCWVSQPDSGGESYNIWNGYTPKAAFYELTNSGPITYPSNTPTPTPSPQPTLNLTPTITPSPTPYNGGGGGATPTPFYQTPTPTPTQPQISSNIMLLIIAIVIVVIMLGSFAFSAATAKKTKRRKKKSK